ncbi:two-component system sensor histidine kinase CreC [Thalassomonas actiniarum]|uniref:histidine kinase n=1 Tax=Thalassomonas actiniarum TaxID=485447 RepID=A0AAE9YR94_9GAMM|nr:two-component system sensor histidine kinase CreC [Thalassomonas actiniarum]WDD99406.1 two-component system sensor histidine kinase CreC [Thalassomonas actiniarum]
MSLNLRIFLAYFMILGVAAYLLLDVFMSELKPGMRQSTEDALVDMSNLLAEMVTREYIASPDDLRHLTADMDSFLQRSHKAKISSINKQTSDIRIYITDAKGTVKYDSARRDVGKDYSQWNDVYLTLRGQYGARSTKSDPDNEFSTVMHVAAPIKHKQQIIGVLTVAKPNVTVQPFIEMARTNIQKRGLSLVLLSLIAALTLSFWLTRSIRKLVKYADAIRCGQQIKVPALRETELAKLATAIDDMRRELEGKDYVEKYVHALTHELKSPVSAIKGASEILSPQMAAADQSRFIGNIQYEAQRIDEMINRLLALVTVEKQDALEKVERLDLIPVINQVISSKQTRAAKCSVTITSEMPSQLFISGDSFLLAQAIDNLLQNALDFSPEGGTISVKVSPGIQTSILIRDQGCGIPAYALDKIFQRFYSLPRPDSQKKSSGLGLCFVKQIAELHLGSIELDNNKEKGVCARLTLNLT